MLPVGNYQATIAAGSVTDTAGLALTANFSLSIPQLLGDWNLDGHVDTADVFTMQRAIVDLPTYKSAHNLSDAQLIVLGDVNGDTYLNNADSQALLNLLLSGGGSFDNEAPTAVTVAKATQRSFRRS